MDPVALSASVAGLLVVVGMVVPYMLAIPRGTVPKKVGPFVLGLLVGVGLAAFGIAWSVATTGSAGAAVVAPSAIALSLGGFFLYLVTQRKVPLGNLRVRVGDSLLPFVATTSDGAAFASGELRGTRTLLKFFRGGW